MYEPFHFTARIEKDDETYLVTFPDVPEAITQGDSLKEALFLAQDALLSVLTGYIQQGKPLPNPSPPSADSTFIGLSD